LLAVAPAAGVAAIVVPGIGAHANAPSSDTRCGDHPTGSTVHDTMCRDGEHRHHGDGAGDDGRASGGPRKGEGHDDSGEREDSAVERDDDATRTTVTGAAQQTSTTTAQDPGQPTSSTTSSSTTSTSTSTSTTSTSTTTTTAAPSSPLTVAEQFTELTNGQPMVMGLTVTNTGATSHTLDVTVEVKGTANLPPYLNVNSDSTQTLLANWSCSPSEVQHPSTDNVFTCAGVVIPASTANVVMVTTGSRFTTSGATVSVTATVTKVDGSTAELPGAVTVSHNVA
jgi:hypothetical protein